MASTQYIYEQANALVNAANAVVKAVDAIKRERIYMKPEATLYPENRGAWLDVYTSAVKLQEDLDELVSTLAEEFEHKNHKRRKKK